MIHRLIILFITDKDFLVKQMINKKKRRCVEQKVNERVVNGVSPKYKQSSPVLHHTVKQSSGHCDDLMSELN